MDEAWLRPTILLPQETPRAAEICISAALSRGGLSRGSESCSAVARQTNYFFFFGAAFLVAAFFGAAFLAAFFLAIFLPPQKIGEWLLS